MHLRPAEYVVHVFKGVRATSRAIGRSPSTISKWRLPRERRGCNGNVPGGARQAILASAKQLGLDITSEDLDFGRMVEAAHE